MSSAMMSNSDTFTAEPTPVRARLISASLMPSAADMPVA